MSLEVPEPSTYDDVGVTEDGLDYDALESLLGEAVTGRESHATTEAFVVRADRVADALSVLKEEAGFDHCSCVTAQQYEDRYESIYHLKKYEDPTQELAIVVPTSTTDPVSQSAESVYRTADWHEREAYDLIGIEYDEHPDLRRILLPETWQGHPLSLDYNQDKPQIVTLREHENALEGDSRGESDTMFLNIGPNHPATHGVLHLKTTLDGEQVIDVESDIGYLHRCEEQICQQGTYRHQIMPYPDRWDYGSAGILNEWAYARTVEDLVGLDVPKYAQVIRTMGAELCRIAAHLLALGTFGLDLIGEFTAVFQYAFSDRETVLDILEDLTGQRLMFNYLRLGGVAWDLPEPREEFFEKIEHFLNELPHKLEEYHDLVTGNEILQIRCIDVGNLDPAVAKSYGCTGPVARGSGIDYDLRRDDPYGYYDQLDWNVVTDDGCDNYSRVLVRLREVEESAKIIAQCVDLLRDWPEDDREIQSNVPRTIKPESDREIYRAVEGAKGELGIYIRTNGTDKPARFKIRSPCFSNLHALPEMVEDAHVPDLIATLGSLDVILGEVDR
ncbi:MULTISPECIES: NADH-quinone oxidoreductase subunit D [Haloarcula]|uniref:NADH dehydrogenase subunit D n=1 Tax=Haloarcula pellucida TaxID=1427151 RepID=A0A830GNT4_9EURY|nr:MULTISPECIES: NADH-quinone oxidoreductase subunit D [Halomicroarcula]MBX0350025.1 NADH-quinone oxidoreductase subunit D [Halomicroarcula pellucida]MDS0279779.1 NADH-quinone oxidoreductase subunit D [Halomicroarcula sp. S1AR25-4]GGN95632.1 NADH dehydrogenase subunit D [Halomicroarcula pellucida]